jgi:hypothetical protein
LREDKSGYEITVLYFAALAKTKNQQMNVKENANIILFFSLMKRSRNHPTAQNLLKIPR